MKTVLLALFLVSAQTATAQTTLKVQWDQNAASDNVVAYNLYVDALPVLSVPNVLNAACACVQSLVPFAVGPHTIKVAATALLVSTDPASLTEGPQVTLTFTLNLSPNITNIKIRK